MPWMMAAGAAIKGITGAVTALRQKGAANKIHPVDTTYMESPYAKQRQALATNMFNARSTGVGQAERNIAGSQANANAMVQRNAMDSSTALAMAAAGQGQADASYENLAIGEDQLKLQQQGLLADAQEGMVQEGNKAHMDRVRKYDNAAKEKAALLAASQQNMSSAAGAVAGGMGSIGGLMSGAEKTNFWGK